MQHGVEVLTHPLWTAEAGRHWLVVVGAFAFAVLVIRYGLAYRAEFPASYSWSEMLINYSGGFVRRGLLGEIAYRLDWLIPARELITTLVLAAYAFVGAWLVGIAIRAGYLVATLFLLSPATLLFPLYDFAAFGRKDVFILAALAGSATAIERLRPTAALAALMLIYAVAGLVIEASWFYFPIAAAILITRHAAERGKTWVWKTGTISALYCGACLALMWLANRDLPNIGAVSEQQMAIVHSWQALYPVAYPDRNAVTWIGWPLSDGIEMALYHQRHVVTATGYALGFLLANVPLILFLASSRAPTRNPLLAIGQAGAILAMGATFLMGADWGRYTYLFSIHAFVFCVLTRRPTKRIYASRLLIVLVVGLYATTWQISHWVKGGGSAFQPGLIFVAK